MRADLEEFVIGEERLRLGGLKEDVHALVAPETPQVWLDSYLDTFRPPEESRPVDVEVTEIELLGKGALVTVRIGTHEQARYYRMTESGWRRAPLPVRVWGEEDQIVTDRFTITYLSRDADVAGALARDLPGLLDVLDDEAGEEPLEIIIVPLEHERSLNWDAPPSSPLLFPSPQLSTPDGELNGEAALRLELATLLWQRLVPQPESSVATRTRRLWASAQEIVTTNWALSAEELERRRAEWRRLIGSEWHSPFLPGAVDRTTVGAPSGEEPNAATHLAADYIYQTYGAEALVTIARQATTTESLDQVFLATIGKLTAEIDAEVAAYVRDGLEAAAKVRSQHSRERPPVTPLEAARVIYSGSQGGELAVQTESLPNPISIDTTNARLVAKDGALLPATCGTLYSTLDVKGDWIEAGERLAAFHMSVADEAPSFFPAVTPAPSDTVAYLYQYEHPQGRFPRLVALLALREDGTTTPVADLRGLKRIRFTSGQGDEARFVFVLQNEFCPQSWLFLIDPRRGTVHHWLIAGGVGHDALAAVRAPGLDALLVTGEEWEYTLLQPGGPTRATPIGSIPGDAYPLRWDPSLEQLVLLKAPASGREWEVRSIDLSSGELIDRIEIEMAGAGLLTRLSPDGRRLFYPVYVPLRGTDSARPALALAMYDLPMGRETILFTPEPEADLVFSLAGDQLLILAGSRYLPPTLPTRLLLLDPEAPEFPTVIADTGDGEVPVWPAVPCSDGRVLYEVIREGREEIRLWSAESGGQLLTEGADLVPAACR